MTMAALLFTDIEASTARWERDAAAMSEAVQRHNEISQARVERAGGELFKLTGDGICALFPTVDKAVEAIKGIHSSLASETWPESVAPIRVRAAVHAGSVESRSGDYYGPALNRVARLMSAGHGGQTLLSMAARDLFGDRTDLTDLGEHRFRDLLQVEHVFQLGAGEFPTLHTLDIRRHNLPTQLTPFVGRRQEITEIGRALDEGRLLTLTGPGGTGKTRLAIQAAAEKVEDFNSIYFVDLTSVVVSDAVVAAIADTMRVSLAQVEDEIATLARWIGEERILLVLDNFERVIEAAPAVGRLLEATPAVSALVTSRELLRIRAERNYPVRPLDLPDQADTSLASVGEVEAIKLFVERAHAVRPDFELSDDNVVDVAAICRRLDGLPLAIELASARLRLFSTAELRSVLEANLASLGSGPRDAPERQRTLHGTVKWSIDLLDDEQQLMVCRLSVFVGGAPIQGVSRVAAAGLSGDVFDVVEALVDKNLIRVEHTSAGETRIQMLETVRAVASSELHVRGDDKETRLLHASYYADLTERAEPELRQKSQSEWIKILDTESANIEAALTWSFEGGDPIHGLRLVAALRDYWFYSGRYRQMDRWSSIALRHVDTADTRIRAGVYLTAGFYAFGTYSHDAPAILEQAVRGYREIDDPSHLALALLWLSGARRLVTGESSQEDQRLQEAMELAREAGAMHIVSQALNMWGEIERANGNYELAQKIQEEALDAARETGEQLRISMLYSNLGFIAHHLGDDDRAKRLILDSLQLANELEFHSLIAHNLIGYAEQLALEGSADEAARLIGTADEYFDRHAFKPQPADAPDLDRVREFVRDRLGDDAYTTATSAGAMMSLEDATALILSRTR